MIYPYVKNIDQLASFAKVENFKTSKSDYRCLETYAKNVHKNEYQLFKKDYNNFKHVIKKLADKGMLTKINQNNNPPNYYKLTDVAIFYLLCKRDYLTIDFFRALLQNYSNNIIIQSFLYPFFHKKTLLELTGMYQLQVLIRYMFESTSEVIKFVTNLRYTRNMGQFLFGWDAFTGRMTHNIDESNLLQLAEFLKYRLNLDWIDDAQIKLEDSKTIVLSKGLKFLQIKLNEKMDKAILSYKTKRWILNVESFQDSNGKKTPFSVYAPNRTEKENALEFYSTRMDSIVISMVTNLLSKPLIPQDVKLLSHDRIFVKILRDVKQRFDNRYEEIIKYKQTS